MNTYRMCILALVAAGAVAAGCGSETTDVSEGIDDLNQQLPAGVQVDCPDEVDGGEGATFDCTMKGEGGGASEKVKMKIVKEGDDLAVIWADEAAFNKAVAKVAGEQ